MVKHRTRKARDAKEVPYVKVDCSKCGKSLYMKKGKTVKCPVCDGNGSRKIRK